MWLVTSGHDLYITVLNPFLFMVFLSWVPEKFCLLIFIYLFLILFMDFRERGREREKERHWFVVPLIHVPYFSDYKTHLTLRLPAAATLLLTPVTLLHRHAPTPAVSQVSDIRTIKHTPIFLPNFGGKCVL